MAHVLQTKPRYRPRGTVSVYLLGGRLVARSWRRAGPDPKTARQQAQRSRLACASAFLKHFAPLVQAGYRPGMKANGRVVGAYQLALSGVMLGGTTHRGGAWRIDYPRVQLAQGRACPLQGLAVQRRGGVLHLSWREGKVKAGALLRVAIYNGLRGYMLSAGSEVHQGSRGVQVRLPKGVGAGPLHLWLVAVDATGRALWASVYAVVPGRTTQHPPGVQSPTPSGPVVETVPPTSGWP